MNSQNSLGWDQKWAIYDLRCQVGEGTFLNKGLGQGYNPILGFSWMAGIRRRFDSGRANNTRVPCRCNPARCEGLLTFPTPLAREARNQTPLITTLQPKKVQGTFMTGLEIRR